MMIANKERLPGPGNAITGKFETRTGLKTPGILFFNEKGEECGGLIFTSKEQDGKYVAGSGLLFDKYDGDQVLGMLYDDGGDGNRNVGFNVWDQPDVPVEEQKKFLEQANKLRPGPEKDALMQKATRSQRVFIGRSFNKTATLTLSDANSRPRIRMSVEPDGAAKLEFLDASGKVIQTLPESSGPTKK